MPRAVVGYLEHHFRAFPAQRDLHRAFFRLALLAALLGRFQPVRHGIAQHVFQRRGHAFEHVAVEFAVGAVELQLDLLAGVRRGLAQHAAQARHQAVERDHARAHQAILQLGADPRLLLQQGVVLAGQVVEHALQAGDVGGRFGQAAAQLLQGGEAVELERIEGRIALVVLALVARHDLRFGLQIQTTQLVVQADVGAVEFGHGAAEGAQLLFQARTIDRDFTGMVDQAVEQVGAHADLFLRGVRHRFVVAGEGGFDGGRKRRQGDRRGRDRHIFRGCLDAGSRFRMRTTLELGDQLGRHRRGAVRADPCDQSMQAVEAALEQVHAVAVEVDALRGHLLQQRFDCMAQVADGVDAGHAGATLDGVQVALQAGNQRTVVRGFAQLGQQAIGVVEQVVAFLHEDIDQVEIQSGEIQRVVR